MIFPRMAQCDFKSFGFSGEENMANQLCVLAPNALSEKIFVILWFWYGLLAFITGLNLLLIISMVFPSAYIRKWYLARAVHSKKVNIVLSGETNCFNIFRWRNYLKVSKFYVLILTIFWKFQFLFT